MERIVHARRAGRSVLVVTQAIGTPEIDLSDLSDLEGTLELLQEVGIL